MIRPVPDSGTAARRLALSGAVALGVAVFGLATLRGLDVRILLLFGLPMMFAALHTGPDTSPGARGLAWSFLAAIGVGAIVAHQSQLFPKLGGFDARLAPWQDRLLTWYCGIHSFFALTVLPFFLFLGSLRAHRRKEPAQFARFTCYLGLFAVLLCCVGMPPALAMLGFWPVW